MCLQTYSMADLLNKKTLITGDVGTGKTRLTEKLLAEALSKGYGSITLIDMAPPRKEGHEAMAGGRVRVPRPRLDRVRRFCPKGIARPRLEGRGREEVLRIAASNALLIAPCISAFCESPTEVLFVNDATMFLHAGDPALLLSAVSMASTFIGNAYSGAAIADDRGSGISAREAEALGRLETAMDVVIRLDSNA